MAYDHRPSSAIDLIGPVYSIVYILHSFVMPSSPPAPTVYIPSLNTAGGVLTQTLF